MTFSSSPDRSESPSPSSWRARSIGSALQEHAAASPRRPTARTTPINGHVASRCDPRAGCDPDDLFDYFTEEEVDYEPTPEPSPEPLAVTQDDVIPPWATLLPAQNAAPGSRCNDPDNISLGRAQDLNWMEDIQAEIADVEAKVYSQVGGGLRQSARAGAGEGGRNLLCLYGHPRGGVRAVQGEAPCEQTRGQGKGGGFAPPLGETEFGTVWVSVDPSEEVVHNYLDRHHGCDSTSFRTVSRKSRWDV
ncbi:hypothetical protein KFL_005690050 [Klebsormidium nitens]|uniref:Uncharacterized protein n=1 Tax=Klebsormidium nitens TaxID=105231 RepID=A0A1Y1IG69_KLENI|nr:hypothetical protein KFL_005690050 [Klebsormidium nitens]|eukprot:GAQ89850.1 hypothetical protein KFL_005690050 [Klebsormidium nitens]